MWINFHQFLGQKLRIMSKDGKSSLIVFTETTRHQYLTPQAWELSLFFRGNSNHKFLKLTTKKHRRLFRKIFNFDFNFQNTLTLTRPLRTKVRMCWFFDDSKVLKSTFHIQISRELSGCRIFAVQWTGTWGLNYMRSNEGPRLISMIQISHKMSAWLTFELTAKKSL